MPIPISNVTRRVVYAASGTGPYAFTFEILANTDIAVYRDDTLLTLTTDYTVTIAANGTGSITLVAAPTGATQIAIVGNRTIQRTTDFVTGGDFFANTVNDEMDQQTIFAQQNAEGLQRALSAPQTDPTSINMTLPRAALRANKALGFDANGNPVIADTLGTNRGNWSASTLYYVRDIIKDTTNSNIWQCIVQHTSSGAQPISTNADVAKWFLLVDAAAAATSATNAAASASAAATSASNASTSASNASSSASTASTQASNASTSASNAASSASAASSSASTASTAATNAGNSATAAATSATNASNSASAASTSASNASSSASAASTSASNASTSATNAANSASTATTQATNASTSASTASTQATNAASSATAAAASATSAAASYDAFDDRYLGALSSNPTLDNDGNALLTGAIYFNSVANTMRVYNGTAWQDQAASPDTIAERSFAATAGQTSYTFTGGYRVGYTYVYVNGALLDTADITATNGTTITFTSALSLNDEVRILSYKAIGSVAIGDISGLQTALDAKAGLAANTFTADQTIYGVTVGRGAGAVSTNTAVGASAIAGSNTGSQITAVGSGALQTNTTGNYNSGFGGNALNANTTGSGNNAFGGSDTLIGSALAGNTTGDKNNAFGNGALVSNLSGSFNSAFGHQALNKNTTASWNTAVGYQSSYSNTTGNNTVSLGRIALYSNTTGNNNTSVGSQSLYSNTTASDNTAMGTEAMYANTTGASNTALGRSALTANTTASNNVAIGYNAGLANTTGASNVAVGGDALRSNTTADQNTAVGWQTLYPNTTGASNTAIGSQALSSNTTGGSNVAVGNNALNTNTTASYNTAVGRRALNDSTTGDSNSTLGYDAGKNITTGSYNTILGVAMGSYGTNLTTGNFNTLIGYSSGVSSASVSGEMLICSGSYGFVGKGGNTGFISPNGGGMYNGANTTTWATTSDRRLKKNIVNNNTGLEKLTQIQVRNFEYRLPEEVDAELKPSDAIQKTGVQLGVIAQELQAILPECVKTESTGVMSVDADNLTWYMINAIKELKAEFDAYKLTHP